MLLEEIIEDTLFLMASWCGFFWTQQPQTTLMEYFVTFDASCEETEHIFLKMLSRYAMVKDKIPLLGWPYIYITIYIIHNL